MLHIGVVQVLLVLLLVVVFSGFGCLHPGYCVCVCVVKKLMVVSFAVESCRTVHSTWMTLEAKPVVGDGVQMGRAPPTKWLSELT